MELLVELEVLEVVVRIGGATGGAIGETEVGLASPGMCVDILTERRHASAVPVRISVGLSSTMPK